MRIPAPRVWIVCVLFSAVVASDKGGSGCGRFALGSTLRNPTGADAAFQRQQPGFGCLDDLSGALRVPLSTSVGLDHHSTGTVPEDDIRRSAAGLGQLDPYRVPVDSRHCLGGDPVAA